MRSLFKQLLPQVFLASSSLAGSLGRAFSATASLSSSSLESPLAAGVASEEVPLVADSSVFSSVDSVVEGVSSVVLVASSVVLGASSVVLEVSSVVLGVSSAGAAGVVVSTVSAILCTFFRF